MREVEYFNNLCKISNKTIKQLSSYYEELIIKGAMPKSYSEISEETGFSKDVIKYYLNIIENNYRLNNKLNPGEEQVFLYTVFSKGTEKYRIQQEILERKAKEKEESEKLQKRREAMIKIKEMTAKYNERFANQTETKGKKL